MTSILQEISQVRKQEDMVIDRTNTNRYRVVICESDGSKSAYCFGVPIYNNRTRRAIDLKFYKSPCSDDIYSVGSNAKITYSDKIQMENNEGCCMISLPGCVRMNSDKELICGNGRIYNTANGFAYQLPYTDSLSAEFELEVRKPLVKVRANDKCFALMSEMFRPFISLSCIGTIDENGEIIAPAKICYRKITDKKFKFTVLPCSSNGKYVLFEANIYEPKLIQDTTVDSKHPDVNNAYGGMSFIGSTKEYGEQWLYSRIDLGKISDLADKKIIRAIMHFPRLNNCDNEVAVFNLSTRFCSFGSTWINKVKAASPILSSVSRESYADVDLTSIITDRQGKLCKNEGIVLKPQNKDSAFKVICTGDCYMYPSILEINYKN